jgi:hypothetical protein
MRRRSDDAFPRDQRNRGERRQSKAGYLDTLAECSPGDCVTRSPQGRPMSAMGQKRTSDSRLLMSALPPKADIAERQFDVRFVPIADIALRLRAQLETRLPTFAANIAKFRPKLSRKP